MVSMWRGVCKRAVSILLRVPITSTVDTMYIVSPLAGRVVMMMMIPQKGMIFKKAMQVFEREVENQFLVEVSHNQIKKKKYSFVVA